MREFNVYCLYNKETNYIFYVGATYRPVVERFREHKRKKDSSSYLYMQNVDKSKIDYAVIEKCDCLHDMYDREYFWTDFYNQFFNLVNKDIGRYHSEETKLKVSGENNYNYGKPMSEEQKKRISEKLTGRKIPRDVVEKCANARRGKPRSKEWVEKMKRLLTGQKHRGKGYENLNKAVVLINTGEVFCCIQDAAEKYNLHSTHISACCRGKRQSTGKDENGNKLRWRYA